MELASFRINDPKTLRSDLSPLSFVLEFRYSTVASSWHPRLLLPSHQGPEGAGPSGPRSAQHPIPASGPLRSVAVASAWPGASPGLASAQTLRPFVKKAEAGIQGQDLWVFSHSSLVWCFLHLPSMQGSFPHQENDPQCENY